jgi:hypothetical protein
VSPERQINELLAAHNFVLDRSHKHRVYRDPAGQIFVMARTPSDRRAFDNALGNLRRLLASGPRSAVIRTAAEPIIARSSI